MPDSLDSAWTEDDHLNNYPDNFNEGLARYVSTMRLGSILEFGSGLGHLARYLAQRGSNVDCIEPILASRTYENCSRLNLYQVDIFSTDTGRLKLSTRYDAVISIEVAEHIPRTRHAELFDFLTEHAGNWLIFSAARPGQGGLGHIAERPEQEWRDEIEARNFALDTDRTTAIRAACDEKNVNHQRNLMVFSRS